jgi:hypothetical protein
VASNVSRFRRWLKALVDSIRAPRRMEITVQTDRLYIMRSRQFARVWCQKCGREVEVVGLEEAGALAGNSHPMLPGHAEACGWHLCPDAEGNPRICLESVLKSR